MNKLYRMTNEDFERGKILYKYNDVKYIVMDGKEIETYVQYFDKIWNCSILTKYLMVGKRLLY